MMWPEVKTFFLCWISLESVSGVLIYLSQSGIKCDGWWPANAKVSYFWGAIWFRLTQAQMWMSQSRLHQKAPFGFINSQRRSSLSIIAMIKMFWSCLAQTWNILTEGITSEVWLLFFGKIKSLKSSFSSVVQKINTLHQLYWDWNLFVVVHLKEKAKQDDNPQHNIAFLHTDRR